jgi:hypothetical protein
VNLPSGEFARRNQKRRRRESMKSNRIKLFSKSLVFAALVAGLLPLTARAQSPAMGEFKLPVEVHWGTATLPKGDYTFSIQSVDGWSVLFVRKEGTPPRAYMISAAGWDEVAAPKSSNRLVLDRVGDQTYVKDLQLGCVGTVLHYRAPNLKEHYLAKSSSPAAHEPEPVPSEM